MEKSKNYQTDDLTIEVHLILPSNSFPNNTHLPLVIYRQAFENKPDAESVKKLFLSNKWSGVWANGIYNYHHYHSTAHEVLGVYSGSTKVQFGGPDGITAEVNAGDVIFIPAGIAHKNLGSSDDFGVVGAYPEGQHYDMNYGETNERPETDKNIKKVPLPETDPVRGQNGDIFRFWRT